MISALIIVCVALREEIEMTKRHSERYSKYQSGTPFMFPLPRLVSSAVATPIVILHKKRLPETWKGVVCVFLVYGAILVLLSLPFLLLNWPLGYGWYGWP